MPKTWTSLTVVAALVVLAIGMSPALAASRTEYAVVRGGSEIGRHVIEVDRQGDVTQVKIATKVQVKMAFITVYRFEQSSTETWKSNQLVALKSDTNDNGDEHHIAVREAASSLRINADGKNANAEKSLLPASLWFPATAKQRVLLNTVKGTQMRVEVADLGDDAVNAVGARVAARHYRLAGELARDVWYDHAGRLVRLQMTGSDGSLVTYELR